MGNIKSSDLSWIVVSDIKKAVKFLTESVGLKKLNFVEEFGWAELQGSEGGAMIGVAEANHEMKAGQNAIITLTVTDIEKTRQDFMDKGINLIGEIMEVPGHCKLQMFSDTDGNYFQLYQNLEKHTK